MTNSRKLKSLLLAGILISAGTPTNVEALWGKTLMATGTALLSGLVWFTAQTKPRSLSWGNTPTYVAYRRPALLWTLGIGTAALLAGTTSWLLSGSTSTPAIAAGGEEEVDEDTIAVSKEDDGSESSDDVAVNGVVMHIEDDVADRRDH